MTPTRTLKINRPLLALVAASLLLALWRFGPLYGTTWALVLTVLTQLYLPGYLLARASGNLCGHPIVRFAWILLSGLSLTIVLGGAARVINLPVATYVLLLHGLMLVLALLPGQPPAYPVFRFFWKQITLTGLLLVTSGVVLAGEIATRYRFYGYEDQAVFISNITWLANNPGETPADGPLRSRQVGNLLSRDSRHDTDGWTYTHAAWVWDSGVSAPELVWFNLDILFVWTVPLLTFALAYELTRRETAAAWSAAALVGVGLLTFDSIAHYSGYTAFGRMAVFQVNVLRQASIALMMPLALLAGFTYLRTRRRVDWSLLLLSGLALAMVHPVQATLFIIVLVTTGGLRWLILPGKRAGLRWLMPLAILCILLLGLPFVQRLNRSGGSGVVDTAIRQSTVDNGDEAQAVGPFLLLPDLPLVGDTFILAPESVFYHPALGIAVVLGLLYWLRVRRSLGAQYIATSTTALLLLSFTPGLTQLYNAIVSSVGLWSTIFILPVPLVLGWTLDLGLRRVSRRLKFDPAGLVHLALAALLLGLLLEPVPIPSSGRDQIQSFNELQEAQRFRPEQGAIIDYLLAHIPADTTTVMMIPPEISGPVVEALPRTLITGGRQSGSATLWRGDSRFFTNTTPPAPWLDSADLAFLREWGVTHIVLRATDTRLPQMLLQPKRFPFLGDAAGYMVFAVMQEQLAENPHDGIFTAMNMAYAEETAPYRWGRDGFNLVIPGSRERWDAAAAEWEVQPESDLAHLGLALAYTLGGHDALALQQWEALYDKYPTVSLYADGAAAFAQYLNPGAASIAPLLANLDSPDATARVLAARSLLTGTYFYLLSPEQLDAVIAVTEAEPVTWGHLADFDQPDALRRRVSLLMNAGRWETAQAWLNQLPAIEISPQDMVAAAAMLLAQGDVDGALAYLQPTTDNDWLAGKRYWHPDRWAAGKNLPEQAYYLLLAEQARRAGRWAQAETAYQQAISAGADIAGRYFLAGMWLENGNTAAGKALRAEVEADWLAAHDTPLPELVPLLTLADTGALYAMQPIVTRQDETTLTVWATYGGFKPHGNAYPVQGWRVQAVNPADGALLAQVDTPARFAEGALVRVPVEVALETSDLPELTPALVIIQPRYDNAVTAGEVIANVVLNRPDAAVIPPDVTSAGLRFGEHIMLDAYQLEQGDDQLTVTLYWEADAVPDGDYQVFVHVVDAAGVPAAQRDITPADNRYPTGQWRVNTVIADIHHLNFETPLPPGEYRVVAGLYRLPDATRLPVTPAGAQVENDAALLGTLQR